MDPALQMFLLTRIPTLNLWCCQSMAGWGGRRMKPPIFLSIQMLTLHSFLPILIRKDLRKILQNSWKKSFRIPGKNPSKFLKKNLQNSWKNPSQFLPLLDKLGGGTGAGKFTCQSPALAPSGMHEPFQAILAQKEENHEERDIFHLLLFMGSAMGIPMRMQLTASGLSGWGRSSQLGSFSLIRIMGLDLAKMYSVWHRTFSRISHSSRHRSRGLGAEEVSSQ